MFELEDGWNRLTSSLGVLSEISSTQWKELRSSYRQPSRHYHNLKHIEALLGHLEDCHLVTDSKVVALAIWFHDIIYNPFSSTNEEDSANILANFAKATTLSGEQQKAAVAYVRATAKHTPLTETLDERLFLDFDLSILGSPPSTYQSYCKNIRAEYHQVPDKIFYSKRKELLLAMISKPTLFWSDFGRDKWQEQASSNIEVELNQITSDWN